MNTHVVRPSVRPSVLAITFERFKIFEIRFRNVNLDLQTEAKFEDGPCRSKVKGSKFKGHKFFKLQPPMCDTWFERY